MRQKRIRARSAVGSVAGVAMYKRELAAHATDRPAQAFPQRTPRTRTSKSLRAQARWRSGDLWFHTRYERDRVGLRDGEAAAARHERSRHSNARLDDGLSAARDGREAMASDPKPASCSADAGRNEVPGRKSRRGCRRGRTRCLIKRQSPTIGHISESGRNPGSDQGGLDR